jgi:hypothetical protein
LGAKIKKESKITQGGRGAKQGIDREYLWVKIIPDFTIFAEIFYTNNFINRRLNGETVS